MESQNPWMGRAKGSAGGMTASKVYDKNILKAKAFEVNNPNTAAQQNQRTFFKEVSEITNQLTETECRFLCPSAPKGMSRRNFIAKQIASKTTTESGQKKVDLSSIKSLGNATKAEIMPIQFEVDAESNIIVMSWDDSSNYAVEHAQDEIAYVIIDITKKNVAFCINGIHFDEANDAYTLPESMSAEDNFNVIPLNIGINVDSSFIENLKVKERPMD